MEAAIAGGVTSLACPPDTDPPLDEPGLVEMLKFRARRPEPAHGSIRSARSRKDCKGARLTEMAELARCRMRRILPGRCADHRQAGAVPPSSTQRRSASRCGCGRRTPALARNGVAHDGQVATRLGLAAIPVCAETVALSTDPVLARETGARVHLVPDLERGGRRRWCARQAGGLPVTCDVRYTTLHLTEMDIGYFDANCHVIPPLRSVRDREALRAALADGTIDAICSDHTPVDEDAKQLPFAEAEAGATGARAPAAAHAQMGAGNRLPLRRARADHVRRRARARGRRRAPRAGPRRRHLHLRSRRATGRSRPSAQEPGEEHALSWDASSRAGSRYTMIDGQVVYEAGALSLTGLSLAGDPD